MQARDLINAHLYPVLATFAVIYGAIQIAPIAQQARYFNACVESQIEDRLDGGLSMAEELALARRTAICNGR